MKGFEESKEIGTLNIGSCYVSGVWVEGIGIITQKFRENASNFALVCGIIGKIIYGKGVIQ